MSDKAQSSGNSNVHLRDGDVLVTDPIMPPWPDDPDNPTFDSAVNEYRNHERIYLIHGKVSVPNELFLHAITRAELSRYVNKLQKSEAVGHDGLKSIYIKLSGTHMCNSLCDLLICVTAPFFPSEMKLIEISPIFKDKK